ncbi:MAG: hypothetical protein FJZ00_13910 [Candidatus Sericytochromatia bacterium]|uniref:Uncharacterized protein n=1 Tax=Candidatus Tanganyikabacteria bacterium TaxID=2961651 RepID=A0A938BPL1_9BACT|nr:hypothetical protein [Candidatus Tanganyikabacteria bacterium]
MDFGPVQTPRSVDFGSASAADAFVAARRGNQAPSAQAQAAAGQMASSSAAKAEPEMRTVGDTQRLAGFLKATAEELASAGESGTDGEDGGSGTGPDLDGGLSQMLNRVEKHAERIFRSILDFAGEDRRLLEQAKGFVQKVFEEFRERSPEPMLAKLTHQRVIDLIEARLREAADNTDIDFSA